HDDRADRARHGGRDGHLGPGRRARLWPQDRRRPARPGPLEPRGHRRLFGGRAVMISSIVLCGGAHLTLPSLRDGPLVSLGCGLMGCGWGVKRITPNRGAAETAGPLS